MFVRAERFEGNREARQALALSIAGVMTILLIWNLIMLSLVLIACPAQTLKGIYGI
jgi:hypothetical protein